MSIDVRFLMIAVLCCSFCVCHAQDETDAEVVEEIADEELRENPVFESDTADNGNEDMRSLYERYGFLNKDANCINLNGADWSELKNVFAESEERAINIVHIGDSHIQADMSTSMVRRLLQNDFGAEGRGLIVPLKLAGTNEPTDYAIRTDAGFSCDRLLRYPWNGRMGFTGISLTPESKTFSVTVSAKEPFERIRVFYGGDALNVDGVEYQESSLVYAVSDYPSNIEIGLPFPCEEVTIAMSTLGSVDIYGMELCEDIIGVAYHAIGINGATCESYNRIDDFGSQIAMLSPDLIIVSLGTNEAFGRLNSTEFVGQVDRLVNELQRGNPEAAIMFVTPAECQRRVKRGRRRSASYTVNTNIAPISRLIREYGATHNIAVYDWYNAAGGHGASDHWLKAGLLSRDRVHCTLSGYELAGHMLYEAITNIIKPETESNDATK